MQQSSSRFVILFVQARAGLEQISLSFRPRNTYLGIEDIPTIVHDDLPAQVSCPRKERYTLQWLNPDERVESIMPNNSDAAFRKRTQIAKPSSLLVHYNYGSAAVKWWGRNVQVLQDEFKLPVPAASGPSTTVGDRTVARNKPRKAQKLAEAKRRKTGRKGQTTERSGSTKVRHGATPVVPEVSPTEMTKWDEDDVMLYLWGNSRAAKDRHSKNQPLVDSFVRIPSLPQLSHFVQHSLNINLLSSCLQNLLLCR